MSHLYPDYNNIHLNKVEKTSLYSISPPNVICNHSRYVCEKDRSCI